jgi:putative hydrolase of the HAD superfamily
VIAVFDLDDTLYEERMFVESGFQAVAEWLEERMSASVGDIHTRLVTALDLNGRGRVFDEVLSSLGDDSGSLVPDCVEIYRTHEPRIQPYGGITEMLARHPESIILTDGDPGVQSRKIDALGLRSQVSRVITTWSAGQEAGKPSLHWFDDVCRDRGVTMRDIIYVGDNPAKDFVNLKPVGATTVRVLTGQFAHVSAPEHMDAHYHLSTAAEFNADTYQ